MAPRLPQLGTGSAILGGVKMAELAANEACHGMKTQVSLRLRCVEWEVASKSESPGDGNFGGQNGIKTGPS